MSQFAVSAVTLAGPKAPPETSPKAATSPVETPKKSWFRGRQVGRIVAWSLLAVLGVGGAVQVVRVLRRPPEVLVVAVGQQDVSRLLAVTGRVEPVQKVRVSPQFSGRITEIVCHEGDRVTKGAVLARLADASVVSDVSQQEAALSSRQHDLTQAKRDLARLTALVEGGASPAAELEGAKLLVSRANADVRRLAAVLREGQSRLVLLAPFDGMIVRRDGEVGQVVGPQNAVFEIATVEVIRVTAEVDERFVRSLRVGMRAEILPVGTEDDKLAATLSYIAQAVDPQTGAVTVRFTYEHAPKNILVGMSVDVNVSVAAIPSAVTIPREAVGGGAAHPFVLLASEGRVVRRDIVVDDWPAPLVVVRSGLKQGEFTLLDPKGANVGAVVRSKVAERSPESTDGL